MHARFSTEFHGGLLLSQQMAWLHARAVLRARGLQEREGSCAFYGQAEPIERSKPARVG